MKYKAMKPFYKGGEVIPAGTEFVTNETHGRELVRRRIAQAVEKTEKPAEQSEAPAQDKQEKQDKPRRKKSDNE